MVVEVVADGECLLPGLPGLRELAGGVAGVAGVGEDFRFGVAVAMIPAQPERELKISGGPGDLAQLMLDVAEGVPRVVLEVAATELGDQVQGLLAEFAGLLVVTGEGMGPGDAVEHFSLGGFMAGGLEKPQRLFGVAEGVGVATLGPG